MPLVGLQGKELLLQREHPSGVDVAENAALVLELGVIGR